VIPAEPPCTLVRSSGDVSVAVHDLGGPTGRTVPVLLFSHATGLHGRVWEPMASHLTEHFRCLAIDYRGHGLSDTPSGTVMDWAAFGDDAVAVLDSELIGPEQVVHGVAHSMGGAALVLAASRRPARFRSLWLYEPVIVPPGGLLVEDGPNPMAEAAERRKEYFGSFEEAVANFASKPPLNELEPAALRSYVAGGFARQPDGSVRLRCLPATEAAVFYGAVGSHAWDVLPSLEIPVAVVLGRQESMGPVGFGLPVVGALPQGVLVERRSLGHFGPLEDTPSLARDVADWVDAHR
jgi:pimeloyl-ACP methyl ester carboxylesterase